jgi:hypothetical protein
VILSLVSWFDLGFIAICTCNAELDDIVRTIEGDWDINRGEMAGVEKIR